MRAPRGVLQEELGAMRTVWAWVVATALVSGACGGDDASTLRAMGDEPTILEDDAGEDDASVLQGDAGEDAGDAGTDASTDSDAGSDAAVVPDAGPQAQPRTFFDGRTFVMMHLGRAERIDREYTFHLTSDTAGSVDRYDSRNMKAMAPLGAFLKAPNLWHIQNGGEQCDIPIVGETFGTLSCETEWENPESHVVVHNTGETFWWWK
jgi:hypothetical protein